MPALQRWSAIIGLVTASAVALPMKVRADEPTPAGFHLPSGVVPQVDGSLSQGVTEHAAASGAVDSLQHSHPDAIATATAPSQTDPMRWWSDKVVGQITPRERWVQFDLETVLLDTLANSPRIKSVSYQASSTFQQIIQQDAAFDPSILLSTDLGATNDPVGNTLTTGGADRLRERSLNFNGGMRQTTRRGTEVEWTQQLGFLDSNSSFFVPTDQGNARLSLGLTKPLLARGQQFYNQRLITQARIESRAAWHEMRGAVEQRIADVISAYWQLYEIRAQVAQQRALMERSKELVAILNSRKDFDAARIEIVKASQRMARRDDQLIELQAELNRLQARLATLVGSEALQTMSQDLELIPISAPEFSDSQLSLRDAMSQALEYRPEIRAAMQDVELSALELKISRVELQPQLNWVFNGYLSQLNGSSKVARSFGEQFANAPGISTALEFELPRGRRAARSQQREALLRSRQRTERLREVIKQTQFEVEAALIDISRFSRQRSIKRQVLEMAIDEENILMVNWRIIGGDDSRVGIKLENLLDAQQRRTDAEKDLVAAESAYMTATMRLQRAMGTLLVNEGIQPHQNRCSGEIEFFADGMETVNEAIADPIAEPNSGAIAEQTAIVDHATVEPSTQDGDVTETDVTSENDLPSEAVPLPTESQTPYEEPDPLQLDPPAEPTSEPLSVPGPVERDYPAPRRLPALKSSSSSEIQSQKGLTPYGRGINEAMGTGHVLASGQSSSRSVSPFQLPVNESSETSAENPESIRAVPRRIGTSSVRQGMQLPPKTAQFPQRISSPGAAIPTNAKSIPYGAWR
ncbi:TolC family protein [Stieleria sp. JC731]|uniref:TolC family protein n=1 Tax=Pirellulaceae TaxID=2691357 RepID=UPI001E63B749|nr:TolC family protein [Stieleria sp. JC731]MCC9603140.1 TolC family protein [Stieleria sp. JC731]